MTFCSQAADGNSWGAYKHQKTEICKQPCTNSSWHMCWLAKKRYNKMFPERVTNDMFALKMAASVTGYQLCKHDYNVAKTADLERTILCHICSAQAASKQFQYSTVHLLNNTSVNLYRCHSLPCKSLLSILLACCDQEGPLVHKPPQHHHHFPAA